MRHTLLRIVRYGLPAAVVLAVLGYAAAEAGGLFLAARSGANRSDGDLNGQAVAALRARLPVAFAAWGFGLVAVFELLNWLVRGTPSPPAGSPAPPPADPLFAELLRRSEAPCPAPPAADNTPGPSPRG